MDLLSRNWSLSTWRVFFDIAASIASIFAAISVIVGMFGIISNRLRKKKFTIVPRKLFPTPLGSYFDFTISNFTNHSLTIIEILLILNGNQYPMQMIEQPVINLLSPAPLRNIPISPYESKDVRILFEVSRKKLPNIIKIKVVTTQKTMKYKISVKELLLQCDMPQMQGQTEQDNK